jgi:hypothetical protein
MKRNFFNRVPIVVMVLMTWFGGGLQARAQNPQSTAVSGTGNPAEAEDTVAKAPEEEAHHSIGESVVANMRSPVGFSLDFGQLYTPDFFATSEKKPLEGYTVLHPSIFAHRTKKRYDFQFDYTFGYRAKNRQRQLHNSDHTLNIVFTRRLSQHAFLQFSDNARSVFNDQVIQPQSVTPVLYQPGVAQQLYLPHERFTSNSFTTNVHYQPGKKININVFGAYNVWRYSTVTYGSTQGFQAGIRADYRMNKWVYLDSGYSHYVNRVDPRFEPANIQRLQIAGLKFRPRRRFEVYLSGGIDATRLQGIQLTTGSYEGGVSMNTRSTLLSLVYHRGYSVAGGPGAILNSNGLSASFSQWLSRRMNVNVDSSYVQGTSAIRGSGTRLQSISSTAEFGFRLQQHVTFSTQYAYISQRGANLGLTTPTLTRYSLTAGFQVFFASLGRRQRLSLPE